MSKPVKEMITGELRERYSRVDNALWVELIGADGITTNELRRSLCDKGMRIEVVRTALLRRAVGDGPLARMARDINGPAALVTGGDSVIDVAKAVEEWMPKIKGLRLRGATLEGEYLDEKRVDGLSRMPTKRDLQCQIASCALSPGGRIAAAALSGGANLAGCLKAMIEKLEKGEELRKAG